MSQRHFDYPALRRIGRTLKRIQSHPLPPLWRLVRRLDEQGLQSLLVNKERPRAPHGAGVTNAAAVTRVRVGLCHPCLLFTVLISCAFGHTGRYVGVHVLGRRPRHTLPSATGGALSWEALVAPYVGWPLGWLTSRWLCYFVAPGSLHIAHSCAGADGPSPSRGGGSPSSGCYVKAVISPPLGVGSTVN